MGLKIPLRSIQIHSARAVALSLMNFLNPSNVMRNPKTIERSFVFMDKDIEEYVREIERIIDVEHESFPLFHKPRGKVILYLLRVFEDLCRMQVPMAIMSGSPENMDLLIHNHLDKIDMAINWAYNNCNDIDFKIDNTIDGEFYRMATKTLEHAGFYRNLCDSYILWSRDRHDVEVDKENNKVKFNLFEDDNLIDSIGLTYREQLKVSEIPLKDFEENIEEFQKINQELVNSISFDETIKYSITEAIWNSFEKISLMQIEKTFNLPDNWHFNNFTIGEFKKFWNVLLTKCLIHNIACLRSGVKGAAVESVVLIYNYEDLCELFISKTDLSNDKVESIIDFITYNYKIKNIDVVWQPIINLKEDLYAISPNLIINNSAERNLITLINKIEQASYSRLSNKKENIMISSIKSEFENELPNLQFSYQTDLPSQLPDIDMACFDSKTKALLIGEIKWLIPTDSIQEVCARDKDLSKGISQIKDIMEYLDNNLEDALERLFGSKFDDEVESIFGCVVSKNNIGSSVLDDSIPIITEKSLLKLFEKYNGNLKLINKKIRSRNYLPEWNKDFKILMEEIQYAGFKFVFPIIRLNIDNDIFIKDKNVKRNDPCPCGAINPKSQKRMKYKKCCGR
jgi:hypothetical protein